MWLRHPCSILLSVWQSEIAIGNRDGIRPNRLNPIVLPWQSRWNRRFDRIIGNTAWGHQCEQTKWLASSPTYSESGQLYRFSYKIIHYKDNTSSFSPKVSVNFTNTLQQWSSWTGLIQELHGGAVVWLDWILLIWLVGWSGFEAVELLELQFSNPIQAGVI
jgi:hypothetical protein